MQVKAIAAAALIACCALVSGDTPKYYCTKDSDCEKNFPGTSCISVNIYGDVISKCTPNTKKRPACRGKVPGLCPSYQSEESDYLNAHCVFVSKESQSETDSDEASGSEDDESGSGRRLMAAASNDSSATEETTPASGSSESSTKTTTKKSSSSSSGSTATVKSSTKDYFTAKINGKSVVGQFVCVDYSDCSNKAYDPDSCKSKVCGNTKEQCTYQGTCTYSSATKLSSRVCKCYKGYSGSACSTEVSGECDVDCGAGGDCVDGECVCKEGFDGEKYDGKQGKSNRRCTKCTNDLACQNNNTCDIALGTCACSPGYFGETCGGTEDACRKMDCGIGNCQVADNGTGACYCPTCDPECSLCDGEDCSMCETEAATRSFSVSMLIGGIVTTVFLANLAL